MFIANLKLLLKIFYSDPLPFSFKIFFLTNSKNSLHIIDINSLVFMFSMVLIFNIFN